MQGALALENHPLGPDGAVKLVFYLQKAGRQLFKVTIGIAHAYGLVSGVGHGQRLVQRGGVALQAVVADGQRTLGRALVAQAAHAQRGGMGQAHGAGLHFLQRVVAPLNKGGAHRRRGAKQIQQQKRMAPEIADQPKIGLAGDARQ